MKKKMNPTHDAHGWNGALYGKSSRESPCAFIP